MRHPDNEGPFKLDGKMARRRGRDWASSRHWRACCDGNPLPVTGLDHPLKRRWRSFLDTHIEPGWLLVYKLDGDTARF